MIRISRNAGIPERFQMTAKKQESNYRIGAVSRLTGIPPDTLRVWERRYDLVTPSRSEGGGRLYSQGDVTRLSVIKRLVDSGHAIGTIAELSLEQLHQRLAETRLTDQSLPASRPVRLVILGATLPQRLRADLESDRGDTIVLVGSYQHREDLLHTEPGRDVDALVVELPMLDGRSAAELRKLNRHCGASRTLVVFGFGSSEVVAQLERSGITTLRFPVTWEEIRVLAGAGIQPPRAQQTTDSETGLMRDPPDRLYDDRQLAQAASISTAIKCECPRHLADLILALCHFEEYSARCENENREDAALHAYLHGVTAKARNSMEQALQKVLEVDGIDLEERSVDDT
jgi:DNA-binding transcriptional MerR regulator